MNKLKKEDKTPASVKVRKDHAKETSLISGWTDPEEIVLEVGKVKLPWSNADVVAFNYTGSFRGLCVLLILLAMVLLILVLA